MNDHQEDSVASRKGRALEKLKRDLGQEFLQKFLNPNLLEVMCNPNEDGSSSIFWEEQGQDMVYDPEMSKRFNSSRAESVIKTIAGYYNKTVNEADPILESQFPIDGSRFTGIMPPVTTTPSFTIRKRPNRVFTLDEYVANGIMTEQQKAIIQQAITNKSNILVIGGTGSGKTTLVNGIIWEMTVQHPNERIYISEDTGEIRCDSPNKVHVYTTMSADLTKLVRTALRFRPDRIVVGEVRGAEALDLLDTWNTGHPGGVATVHANSAVLGLERLEGLITRNPFHPTEIRQLIAQVVNIIIFISKDRNTGRKIREIIKINGYNHHDKSFNFEYL
jgi:P-type conjugative transfer ATPase trbB